MDGDRLQFTDFARGVIPPPMSQICVKYEEPIRGVARIKKQPYLLVVLSKEAILYHYKSVEGKN